MGEVFDMLLFVSDKRIYIFLKNENFLKGLYKKLEGILLWVYREEELFLIIEFVYYLNFIDLCIYCIF